MTHATDRHSYRHVSYDPQMLADLERWRDEDPQRGARVVELIEAAIAGNTDGLGRPKRIGGLPGVWSYRITKRHRLIYIVQDGHLHFFQCWDHDLPESLYRELRAGRWQAEALCE